MRKFNGHDVEEQPDGEFYLVVDADARIAELEQDLAECNRLLGEAQRERGLGN